MLSKTGRQRRATIPLSNKSFDAFGLGHPSGPNRGAMGGGDSLLPIPNPVPRRGSFLYRHSDSDSSELSPMSLSRKLSSTTDQPAEEFLVTPFAQILQSLRSVRENYLALANVQPNQSRMPSSVANPPESDALKQDTPVANPPEADAPTKDTQQKLTNEQYSKMAEETLSELEWCLEQLETMQTHKSVSDMATIKFKRMLSRELNQFSESSRAGNEISEYIINTFVEKQEFQLPVVSIDGPEVDGAPNTAQAETDDDVIDGDEEKDKPEDNSMPGEVPLYGVEAKDETKLAEVMSALNSWGPDVFRLAEVTNSRPLTAVTFTVLREMDALKLLKIPASQLLVYLSHVEENYNQCNLYHNSTHAADVTQTSDYLLRLTSLQNIFTDLELLAAVIASAVHDVDHPGVTNQYLIESGLELAVMYNDMSVLENHHLAVAFTLLKEPGANIFEHLSVTSYQTVRRMIIEIVLATDMSMHMSLLADLKTMVETQKITRSGILHLDNYSDRMQVLKTLVHCADLSNPTKPLALYRQWTDRIMEEFFRQGDLERNNGLEISPMCDRYTASIEKSQVGFISYIVHPLWETWSELVYPDCQDILDILESNRDWFHGRLMSYQGTSQDDILQEEPNEDDEDDEDHHHHHHHPNQKSST